MDETKSPKKLTIVFVWTLIAIVIIFLIILLGFKCNFVGHDYMTTKIEPTCSVEGYTEFLCKWCGDTYIDEKIPVLAHKYEKETTATCEHDGIITYTCEKCSDTYTEEQKATGHDWGKAYCKNCNATNPTATELDRYEALTDYKKEKIVDWIKNRYEYYDEINGGYSGDKYSQTVMRDAADFYDLSVDHIFEIWLNPDYQ